MRTLDFKAIFQATPSLHLILSPDPSFTILAASDAQLRATYMRREDIGRPVFEVFRKNPDDPQEFGTAVLRASLERVLQTRAADRMAITKYDIPRPESKGGGFEQRYWRPLNVPVLDEQGALHCIIHQVEDVTDEVLSHKRGTLSHSNERFRAALLASGTGTFIWYLDDGSMQLDSALEQTFGLGFGQRLDSLERLLERVHPQDRQRVRETFERYAIAMEEAVEFRLADTAPAKWLTCKAKAFRDANGHLAYVAGACTDITARKLAEEALRVSETRLRQLNDDLEARVASEVAERSRTEEALRQSQKMEAVGQLTGGIAHDFNNLLTGIVGSLDLMQRRHARGEKDVDRYINAAVTSAQRAAALTQRLLAFSRRQTLHLKPVDVNQLVASLEDLLHRTTGENITLETKLSAGLLPACMDANQLESAVINLVINARDAMPHGGHITVSTASFVMGKRPDPAKRGLTEGEYILLTVTDTGTGMTPEVIARAFEPFFTTKPIGQGTGLGLSMVYGFVKQTGGHVRIDSTPGQGTLITLFLPRNRTQAEHAEELKQAPEAVQGAEADETVLVVEDEAAVRMLVVEVLQELGYRVLEAVDGNSALPYFSSDQRIDLLVSDIGLPGINGRQLAEIARQHRPELRVLFITGYAPNAEVRGEFLGPGMDMLAKPFSVDVLGSKVRQLIERNG